MSALDIIIWNVFMPLFGSIYPNDDDLIVIQREKTNP